MELRKRLNSKYIFIGLYIFAFLAYIIYGLQPAEAVNSYDITGEITIPSINLTSDVTNLSLDGNELHTPDTIVGSFTKSENKTLLIGHSTEVFKNLEQVKIGDEVDYSNKKYVVSKLTYVEKSKISMKELLKPAEEDTLVIMTCAGELTGNGDATHRLIITAVVR